MRRQTMYSRNSETSRSSMGASSILGFEMPKGVATTSRTAAYGRAVFAWAVKRGAVRTNPFPDLPVAKGVGKRERVLSDQEIAEIWRAAGDWRGRTIFVPMPPTCRRGCVSGAGRRIGYVSDPTANVARGRVLDD